MGDGYEVLVSQEVHELLDDLDEKSARIVRDDLEAPYEPYPGEGRGDEERITRRSQEGSRLAHRADEVLNQKRI